MLCRDLLCAMGYPKKIYDDADIIMSERRNKAKTELELNRSEIYGKLPVLRELEYEIASYALNAVKSVTAGEFNREVLENYKKRSVEAQNKVKTILVENGYSPDSLDEKYCCLKCEDTGYIDGVMCECKKKLLKEIACKMFSTDAISSDCRFENFSLNYYPSQIGENLKLSPKKQMSMIFDYCKAYVNNFSTNSKNILMMGATGLGKTHLSVAMAYELTKNGFGVIYCSAPDMARKLESEYFGKNGDAPKGDTEQSLLECDLLVIDDLGTEFINKYSQSSIYNIINIRINMGRPTVISTNLSAQELHNTYGMRFVSRIIGEFDKLNFVGTDIRQIKKRNA